MAKRKKSTKNIEKEPVEVETAESEIPVEPSVGLVGNQADRGYGQLKRSLSSLLKDRIVWITVAAVACITIGFVLFLSRDRTPEGLDLSRDDSGMLKVHFIEDNYSFTLPAGWKVIEPEENSWNAIFASANSDMLLRISRREAGSRPLLSSIVEYVRRRTNIEGREGLEEILNRIHTLDPPDIMRYNVDDGAVIHIVQGRTAAEGGWQREHLFGIRNGEDLYFFSFLAQQDFGATEGQAMQNNPVLTFAASFEFH